MTTATRPLSAKFGGAIGESGSPFWMGFAVENDKGARSRVSNSGAEGEAEVTFPHRSVPRERFLAERSSLFDEPWYTRINEARWAAAERVVSGLAAAGRTELRSCLDVGCGPGWFSARLAATGLDVTAVDGREETLEEARRRVPGVRFVRADVDSPEGGLELPVADLVFCFGLLYHVENPFLVTRRLRRACGKLLLLESQVAPLEGHAFRLVDEGRNETQGLTHLSLVPSLAAIVRMLAAAGFDHVYGFAGRIDHEDFEESASRLRRRHVLVATLGRPLAAEWLERLEPAPAPKCRYDR